MAFEGLTGKIQNVFRMLTSRGKLTEKEVKDAMKELKLVLLEADVNYIVVKQFINKVTEKAVGTSVLESLTPGQQVIKIVKDELIELLGTKNSRIDFGPRSPSVILMCGLQGAGKTTVCAKLAKLIQKEYSKKVLLVACDVYRPAAIEQLKILAEKIGTRVFENGSDNPVSIAKNALKQAQHDFYDVVIIDTAGRLHIDEDMMIELQNIKKETLPAETFLVVDSMTGQDAVNVAKTFNETIGVSGLILTKLDGDTRGGAALSINAVTGKPIKYVGTGEKIDDIEVFHPDRMASRILGMGDVLTLIEKAEKNLNVEKTVELNKKLQNDTFTLNDFLDQMEEMKSMGSMQDVLKMIPGANKLGNVQIDEKQMLHTKAIIQSMTNQEREKPEILNASRRKRIAAGCGLEVHDVNQLISQFTSMKKMFKQFSGKKMKKNMFGRLPFQI